METLERQRQLERELIDTMDRKVRSQERLLAMKDATITELELRITSVEQTSYDGTLLWRITDFQRKRQDAISGRVTSIYSPPFFTSRTGQTSQSPFLIVNVNYNHCHYFTNKTVVCWQTCHQF